MLVSRLGPSFSSLSIACPPPITHHPSSIHPIGTPPARDTLTQRNTWTSTPRLMPIDLQFSSCASGEGSLPIAPLYGVMHAGLSHASLRQASWRGASRTEHGVPSGFGAHGQLIPPARLAHVPMSACWLPPRLKPDPWRLHYPAAASRVRFVMCSMRTVVVGTPEKETLRQPPRSLGAEPGLGFFHPASHFAIILNGARAHITLAFNQPFALCASRG